ncbi:hypothetical protein PVAND_004382 [Polypedilum vanderplanki]|uniref:Ras-associating domain-containing protein n=1 Tax=Polypedilum vanderplanki TaxID=319348 RepID=A0A9J6BXJ7_POLVA|nr:hypothetical protein PVAND_004382 [Polypedilum vanderplanki]
MKNNYKQLTKSPSEPSLSILKRSASHALRSSFRLPKKRANSQFHALNLEQQLPNYIPPKAAAILQINVPPSNCNSNTNEMLNKEEKIKIATIRKRSVWANSVAKISLPSSYKNEREDNEIIREKLESNKIGMHIGGFNFLQQNKTENEVATAVGSSSAAESILKEFNKNTSNDNFKAIKKYKFGGHVNKSFEPSSSAYALFECVEDNKYDQLKSLLEQKQLNVNALNNDGFSVLDLAVLINNRAIIKLLLQHQAQTGNFPKENIESHLNTLLADAEKKLSQCISNAGTSTSQGIMGFEIERQKLTIEKRIKLIRKMINGWQRLKVPDPPFSFTIDVIGGNSVLLKILEPIVEETICTTFKVQYSPREDFSIIIAEKTITEWNIFQGTMGVNFHLENLIQKRRYYFRACSGNIKGYGNYKISNPASIVPSSWKDIEEKPRDSNFLAQKNTFETINKNMLLNKLEEPSSEDQRRNQKKKTTIKQLFTTVSKFQKSLRRASIYLACIIFSDEKVLVTSEDFIPVIEIDESYPNNLNSDFYWLMKISTSWEDVKNLRIEMEKNSTNKMQFRFKILNAIHQLQMSLGITDLGQFYYKPLKDANGTVVLSCSLYMKDLKTTTLHTKWISMSKLQKKVTVLLDDSPINEILLNSIQSQINYYQASKVKLSRGLYLGYLKMFSSMDTIQVICQAKTPNVLPNCKIRDNPHVSAEEWSVLKKNLERDKEGKLSQAQENFIESLKLSLNRLFKFMNVDSEDALNHHRIYDTEVIELDNDVSFLIVCPSPSDTIVSKGDTSCGNVDLSLKRSDLISIPLVVHEMIQFNTYQTKLLQNYARLSFLTEFDMITANLKQREAFSTNELQIAKEKFNQSQEIMNELNAAWKSIRWMMDVITFYRSKETTNRLDIKKVLQFVSTYNIIFKIPDTQMRGFHVKSPIRGSWAAPQSFSSLKGSEILMYGEHSKSEQILNNIETHATVISKPNSTDNNRKASIDSTYFSAGEQNDFSIPRLPTSKSEDTLVVTRKKGTSNVHQRKRPTTINPSGLEIQSSSSSSSSKPSGLVVHRINQNHQMVNEIHSPETSKSSNETSSPSKSKLRVSHHPKSNTNQKKDIKKYHAEEESTLVTFLKPTLTAIQNESHNRSFKDPLLIVEDEAIEMISSPFSKTPVERSKSSGSRQQLFGKSNTQFFRSSLHSKNVHAICQDSETESADWRAFNAFKQTENTSEEAASPSFKSDIQSQIEEMLMRDYVNQPSHDSANSNNSSILQVYAAYDSGLATGTSLKLKCTQKTTAKDLVDLVVKQLNMAVVLKGKDGPIYGADQLNDFCLVAVIGARERCLRDDFRPLELQNPWKKGKLFVRFKHDLLSAIEINASNREALSL